MSDIKKRIRDLESENEIKIVNNSDSDCEDSPEAKRIRSDLLGILDEEAELEPAVDESAQQTPDLALVMKSFEEEIAFPPPHAAELLPEFEQTQEILVQPEIGLGYLLEASDDELGLPPAAADLDGNEVLVEAEELPRVPSYGFGLEDDEQMWRFEDEMQSYDFGGVGENSNSNGEFLALDGLFDHSDISYPGQSDFSDFSYRPESLSAL